MDKELEFLTEKVLKKETNKFLQEIDHLMTEDGIENILSEGTKALGKKQFKTLMDATEEAACIEELLLFLSYQKSKVDGWKTQCKNQKTLADNLVDSFMKIQNEIYHIIEKENKLEEISKESEREVRLKIAKKYMGYLFWKASAVSKS